MERMEVVEGDCEVRELVGGTFKSHFSQNNIHPPVLNSQQEFCNEENINDCLIYLNQELINRGMNCMFTDPNDFKISSIINSMFGLLQKIHQSIVNRDSLEESRHKALSEVERVQAEKRRLKSKLDASEKELITYKNKVDFLSKELTEKELKVKSDKDEVRNLQALLRSINMQHKNAAKKDEKEIRSLKEKLNCLLSEKRCVLPGTKFQESLSKEDGVKSYLKNGSIKKDERFSFWQEENLKIQNDLKQLHRKLCMINAKYFGADGLNLINGVPQILGFKSELLISKNEISGSSTGKLIKSIEEQIVHIQKKLEKNQAIGGREPLKDRSISKDMNMVTQPFRKATFISKAGGDSAIRPKSAIPTKSVMKKRNEVKEGKSFLLGNLQKCHWLNENNKPVVLPTTTLETCDDDEDEGETTTKKPRRLIRSESYTILKALGSESAVGLDMNNLTSNNGSVLPCASNGKEKYASNGTFICEHTLSNIDYDSDSDKDDIN